ncbi:uncharacterized protein LOC130718788 [Lotus japonicus]|uniref:uncharacterized protein LOC130718788 n=1 Tax=Lotus japonicus TaxID=34305 RepID=UPI0025852142|nr:uncharacterized protein LOC130718788 [Lotus japonicus]
MLRLEGEKKMDENHRDLRLMSSQGSATVIDGLKEDIYRVIRDKIEFEMLDNARVMKTVNLELEVRQLTESLKISRNEEAIMRAKVLELEQRIGVAVEKEEEMARKCSALASEKKDMEKSVEVLTEKRDSVCRVLDMVQRELESKRREVDVANSARDEIERVKVSHEYKIAELQGEVDRVRDVVDELYGSFREFKDKNEELVSQVRHYKKSVDEVMLEKENMRKGFEVEKKKVEKLELQVAGLEKKIEQAATELGRVRSERNIEPESNVDVLMKEKEALQNNLMAAQLEWDDLSRDVGNKRKRSSPAEGTSLRKKGGTFEQSHHVQGENGLESDPDFRISNEDNCSPLDSNLSNQYPDTDFNDFDKDKAEECFAVNQIWAVYDSPDVLPRIYALVRNVASPFKLTITWMEPDPDDQKEIDWHDAGLPIACGKFKLGASEDVADLSIFSHQIKFLKIGEGSYVVYPKKGETWAIFRYWDIKWSSNPETQLKGEFEFVEILSDFTQNVGIEVARLVKVKGFVSLFQKSKKKGVNVFYVLPNELYRFSHRIPSYKMTGKERKGVPKGCFELDTLALPTNFF